MDEILAEVEKLEAKKTTLQREVELLRTQVTELKSSINEKEGTLKTFGVEIEELEIEAIQHEQIKNKIIEETVEFKQLYEKKRGVLQGIMTKQVSDVNERLETTEELINKKIDGYKLLISTLKGQSVNIEQREKELKIINDKITSESERLKNNWETLGNLKLHLEEWQNEITEEQKSIQNKEELTSQENIKNKQDKEDINKQKGILETKEQEIINDLIKKQEVLNLVIELTTKQQLGFEIKEQMLLEKENWVKNQRALVNSAWIEVTKKEKQYGNRNS